jgi:hypothetical protein
MADLSAIVQFLGVGLFSVMRERADYGPLALLLNEADGFTRLLSSAVMITEYGALFDGRQSEALEPQASFASAKVD